MSNDEYETITINIESKLRDKLDEYDYFHKKNKINRSEVCRKALWEELKRRGVE